MLRIDASTEAAGITCFADHLVPNLYHYLPAAPRVASDDAGPKLRLTRYRGGASGGLLRLEVDLAHTADALAAARAELEARGPGPVELVPVLFDGGTARLTTLGVDGADAPRFVERVLGSTVPGLLGRNAAIFALTLGAEGATLLEAALALGATPLLVVYDLAYAGLHPARNLRARIHTEAAYRYLRARLAASSLWFRADLDREAEAMSHAQHIEIEDVDETGSDPAVLAARADEVRATLRELVETVFFRPATSPVPAAASAARPEWRAAWSAGGFAAEAFVLRDLAQDEVQDLSYDLTEARVMPARVAPQAALSLPPEVDRARLIHDVTTGGDPPRTVTVLSPPGADWTGVAAITVNLRAGDDHRAIVLTADHGEDEAALPPGPAPVEVNARLLARPEDDALGAPPAPDDGFAPLDGTTLILDPAVLARRRVVELTLGVFDPAAVSGVDGRLVLGDRAIAFLLGPARPSLRAVVYGAGALAVESTWRLGDGPPLTAGGQIPADQTVAVLNQPPGQTQPVQLELVDPLGRVASASVELEGPGGARRGFALDPAHPTARGSVRRDGAGLLRYRHRVQVVFKDSRVVDGDWQEATGTVVLVGDTDARAEPVQVVVLGAAPLGALIQLTSLAPPDGVAPTVERLLDPGQTTAVLRLPFRKAAPRSYHVEATLFSADDARTVSRDDTAGVLLLGGRP